MTPDQAKNLVRGDLIRNKSNGQVLVVELNLSYCDMISISAAPVRTQQEHITRPEEWDIIPKNLPAPV